MHIRLGEVMVKRGLLSQEQVAEVLKVQQRTHRPFGVLAEELFGVQELDVEAAWAEQYASLTRFVDVTALQPEAAATARLTRRQAWQFRVFPVRIDAGELVLATTVNDLARALRFASRCLCDPCYFVITEARQLGEALASHYPMGGMTPQCVMQPAKSVAPKPRAAA